MKIVAQTPDRLVLRAFSWTIAVGLMAVGATIVGALVYALLAANIIAAFFMFVYCVIWWIFQPHHFVDWVKLTLDATKGTITVVRKTLKDEEKTTFRLDDLIEANVWEEMSMRDQFRHAAGRGKPLPILVLILNTADPPEIYKVPGWRISESETFHLANAINAWLSRDVDTQAARA